MKGKFTDVMTICELCKKSEATIHLETQGTLDLCKNCLEKIQTSFGYYIDGNEVVKEEYENRIADKIL
jgi:hypothetical protein